MSALHASRRSVLRAAGLGLTSAVAGCSSTAPGTPESGTRDDETTTTASATDTTTPTTESHAVNDCGFLLNVERADEADVEHVETVLDFANLSRESKREFRNALENGSVELANGTDPYDKGSRTIVTYDGTDYAAVLVPC